MKFSDSFVTTLREAPKDAETINHKLLVRAGFVRQLMAGVYTYLPLGQKVLNKISQVVREEMDAIGGKEVLMPLMHPAEKWKKTGAWDKSDVLFHVIRPLRPIRSCLDVPRPIAVRNINSP